MARMDLTEKEKSARVAEAYGLMEPLCFLCPRSCGVDRRSGRGGYCRTGKRPFTSSVTPHFGEEAPLVGRGGSGTVFLSGCNLQCVFCQNFDISTGESGRELSVDKLAQMMLGLERWGCHNVNFVTPTHQTPAIMEAILVARSEGLSVPIVYNCGGYESLSTLALLEGFIEIYMPDVKFLESASAQRYCSAPDYPEIMKSAVREMHRQVGDLEIRGGLAVRGLLVRHLVMPGGVREGVDLVDFLADSVSRDSYLNVMPQYRPMHRAWAYPEISRPPTHEEFSAVYRHAEERGLRLAH